MLFLHFIIAMALYVVTFQLDIFITNTATNPPILLLIFLAALLALFALVPFYASKNMGRNLLKKHKRRLARRYIRVLITFMLDIIATLSFAGITVIFGSGGSNDGILSGIALILLISSLLLADAYVSYLILIYLTRSIKILGTAWAKNPKHVIYYLCVAILAALSMIVVSNGGSLGFLSYSFIGLLVPVIFILVIMALGAYQLIIIKKNRLRAIISLIIIILGFIFIESNDQLPPSSSLLIGTLILLSGIYLLISNQFKLRRSYGALALILTNVMVFLIAAVLTVVSMGRPPFDYSDIYAIAIFGLASSFILLIANYVVFKKAPAIRLRVWGFTLLGLLPLLSISMITIAPGALFQHLIYANVQCTNAQWVCPSSVGDFGDFVQIFGNGGAYLGWYYPGSGFEQNISEALYNVTFLVSGSHSNNSIGTYQAMQTISVMQKNNDTLPLNLTVLLNQNNIVTNEGEPNGVYFDFNGSLWASYAYTYGGPLSFSRLGSIRVTLENQSLETALSNIFYSCAAAIQIIIAVYVIGFGVWAMASAYPKGTTLSR